MGLRCRPFLFRIHRRQKPAPAVRCQAWARQELLHRSKLDCAGRGRSCSGPRTHQ